MGILFFHNFALIIKTKLCTKIYPKLCFLNRLSHFLSHEMLLKIYKQTILPAIDYGSIIWIDCSKVMSDKLERLQNQAPRSIPKKGQKEMHPVVTRKMSFALSKKPQTFLTFPTRFCQTSQLPRTLRKLLSHKGKFTIKIIKGRLIIKHSHSQIHHGAKDISVLCCKGLESTTRRIQRHNKL